MDFRRAGFIAESSAASSRHRNVRWSQVGITELNVELLLGSMLTGNLHSVGCDWGGPIPSHRWVDCLSLRRWLCVCDRTG
jgi:hypothetical protein